MVALCTVMGGERDEPRAWRQKDGSTGSTMNKSEKAPSAPAVKKKKMAIREGKV
jgi:hypothetical protein